MNSELQNLKKILSSYEDQNSKIVELENKIKIQNMKYSRKIKEIEDTYDHEITELNKKIYKYENLEYSSTLKKQKYKKFKNNNNQILKSEFNKYDNVKKNY